MKEVLTKALKIFAIIFSAVAVIIVVTSVLGGCVPEGTNKPVQAKQSQSQKAAAVASTIKFTENAEIDNIKKRLELTSQPGLLGYVILLNEMGQPVMYTSVKGKITSGGKRLTAPFNVTDKWDMGEWYGMKDLPAPSDEGTWGHSNPYVFFWTVDGQYIQWNGKYLYSDKPFRLTKEPLVVNIGKKE